MHRRPTRARLHAVALGLLLVALHGCAAPDSAAPDAGVAARLPRGNAVYPPSQYKITLVPGEGVFEDVSGRNLIVGFMNDTAIAMPLNGSVAYLDQSTALSSRAHAVNNAGQIVGHLNYGTSVAPKLVPAFWRNLASQPFTLNYSGEAVDINDHGLVVANITRNGLNYGIVWDQGGLVGATVTVLPPLPRGRSTTVTAINNDWVILGASESASGWQQVLWRRSGSGWVPKAVTGGIEGYDLDAAQGIVGLTNFRASFGDPNHAGYFPALGPSMAYAVSDNGVATGDDAGSSPGWPQNTAAFVADRGGNFTVLPMPNNPNGFAWRASYGYGINSCGVVVGTGWAFPGHPYTAQPMVWDPGC